MLARTDIEMDPVRLDRYYYYYSTLYADKLGRKIYLIPNSTLKGSKKWKNAIKDFISYRRKHM
ncbi:MAG: hypothetical protein JRN10_02960 [Nitrososphaerota archaeon]|jgi:transposase|nr:hypothetical protein [Nitrososphaerota archaeon]MDG7037350.1 hypothetical protein [Nitrososphaerota archaeon]MDG7039583.1 hypothetical protein [Nitrososphaerota archaeon]MDG7045757.1 hypothetical protein [Nitrososphaerota archaeon]